MFKRHIFIVSALALVLSGLTGCSQTDGGVQGCFPSGNASRGIAIEGDFGSRGLKLSSETPVHVSAAERDVLIHGSGAEIAEGDAVQAVVTVFNGESGDVISSEPARLDTGDSGRPWVRSAILCATAGDRVVAVIPASELYGAGRVRTAGIADLREDSSLVVVVDLERVVPGVPGMIAPESLLQRAEGTQQEQVDGLPRVALDESGEPTVSIEPQMPPPTELLSGVLIEGAGAQIAPGDRVYFRSKSLAWQSGDTISTSWGGAVEEQLTTGMLPGLERSIVGQRVGSQLIVVLPADAGFGAAGLEQLGLAGDEVMVIVVDILGVVQAAK